MNSGRSSICHLGDASQKLLRVKVYKNKSRLAPALDKRHLSRQKDDEDPRIDERGSPRGLGKLELATLEP